MSKCSIPSEAAKLILDDIFGRRLGSIFEEGLVDASDDDDFQMKLDALLEKWRNLGMSSSADVERFLQYFVVNKVAVIRNTMLRPIRLDCGLGNPPDTFTTNASESINALLKHTVDYKRNELPVFIGKVKELAAEQQMELERAIIGRGKYQLRERYQFLHVTESKWFTMNTQQRARHLSKVQSLAMAVTEVHESASIQGSAYTSPASPQMHLEGRTAPSPSVLSVDVLSAAQGMTVPLTCMEGIWNKATELLNDPSAMSPAPGQSLESQMVLSYSGSAPHLVTPVKGGGYSCDANCPNWKSLAFCSHTVAVAQRNGQLPQFLQFLRKKKKPPNVTSLVTANMPRGRGRKGGVAPRTRRPQNPYETRVSMQVGVGSSVNASGGSSVGVSNFAPVNLMQPPSFSPGVFYPGYLPYPSVPYLPSPHQSTGPGVFPAPAPATPFTLCFIKGNIATCIGCNNRYTNKQPPNDLCIKHQEWRQFTPQGTDSPQSKFSNVYYHCRPECVWLRYPDFVPAQLEVPDEVHEKLCSIHKAHLASVFGLFLP